MARKKKKKKYLVGLDLGGTKMLAGILNRDFKILGEEKSKVRVDEGEKAFIQTICETLEQACESAGVKPDTLAGIGMGCPGIINTPKGRVLYSPNIPFLKNYPLAEKLRKIFNVPVVLGNDVNVGLFGEHRFGAAKGYDHVIGVFMGTGIGGALILNGEIYEGATGAAGEIGHMIMDSQGPVCGCGARGCLEAYAGRFAIASEAAVLAARQTAPNLYEEAGTEISKIKSGVLAKAIKAGDKAVAEIVRARSRMVGTAMANLANVFNPELFVLGGGLVEALGDLIIPEAEESMRKTAMEPIRRDLKVLAARLGDYAIVMGAAKMISEYLEKE